MSLHPDHVRRFLHDPTYKAILDKVRLDQLNAFRHSKSDEMDKREEAHAIIRALDKIEQALHTVLADEAIKEKRKK